MRRLHFHLAALCGALPVAMLLPMGGCGGKSPQQAGKTGGLLAGKTGASKTGASTAGTNSDGSKTVAGKTASAQGPGKKTGDGDPTKAGKTKQPKKDKAKSGRKSGQSPGDGDPDRPKLDEKTARAVKAIEDLGGSVKFNVADEVVEVDLSYTEKPATNDQLKPLAAFPHLRVLNLRYSKITDAGLQLVGELKSLAWLFLTGTSVTDDGLKHLRGLTKLEWLCLDGCQFSDAGVANLEGMTEMERLHIRSRKELTKKSLSPLHGMKQMFELYISSPKISPDTLAGLRRRLPRLRTIAVDPFPTQQE